MSRVTVSAPTPAVVEVTGDTTTTITTAASGPQGPAGTTPIYSRAGQLAPLVGQGRFYFESACVIGKVRASVGTVPVGDAVVIDVNVNGVSIFTDQAQRPSIEAGTSTDTSTPNRAVNAGDYITVDIDSVGTTNPGADLTVTVTIQ